MTMTLRALAVGVCVLALPHGLRADGVQTTAQGTAQVSAADAAPFLGEWTLALQGPNGPGTFTLSIRAEKERVVAEIASEVLAKQQIATITRADKSLVLGYSFTYDGNPVDAVVTVTPEKDGKMAASIDFAGGAYVMTGIATKK